MKKLAILSIVFLAFLLNLTGQDAPAEIRSDFENQYPEAENITWAEEEGMWEAGFLLNDKKMSITFDKNGKWIETETEIGLDEVPKNIIKQVKNDFPESKILETESVEKPDFTGYEIEIETIENEVKVVYELYFSEDGTFVQKIMEEEETENPGKKETDDENEMK